MSRILSSASQIRNRQGASRFWGKAFLLGASLFSTALLADSVGVNKSKVHEYALSNGLKILVKQDTRAPVAVLQLWYKVGSSYEHSGITGVSHVLEHMMFKGTEKYPTGEFNRIIAENGAEDNAFTSLDYTAYYQVIASDRVEVAMELESDRMRGLTLPEAEFKKEVEVVKEERRWRTEDKPNAITREQFMATAFFNNPYGNPVIGWRTDLDNMQIEDLQAWYQRWYAPNNATLVVAGDVDPDHIYELAKKYYGDIEPSDIKPPKPRRETEQKGKREIVVKAPARVPIIMMGFRTPALVDLKESDSSWEPYALSVLSRVLSGGGSSRMVSELVRGKEIAASASAWYSGSDRMGNLFMLSGVPAKDVELSVLREALLEQVERLKTERVSEKELSLIKAQVIAGEVYGLDSVQQQATIIGSLESVGLGYELMDQYVERVSSVTPEQIQQVAVKYFVEDQLTVAELDPQPIDPNKSRFEPRFAR